MRRAGAFLAVVGVAVASVGVLGAAPASPAEDDEHTGYTVLASNVLDMAAGSEGLLDPSMLLASDDVGALQTSCVGQLAEIDLETGEVDPLPDAPSPAACAVDLAFAPDGDLYGLVAGIDTSVVPPAQFAELVEFDTRTGDADVIGRIGDFSSAVGFGFGGLTFDAQGALYAMLVGSSTLPNGDPECATAYFNSCLYQIEDPDDPGDVELVGVSLAAPADPLEVVGTLAASCDDTYSGRLRGGGATVPLSSVATLDVDDADLDVIGDLATGNVLFGADFADSSFDHDGDFYGITASVTIAPSPPVFVFRVSELDPEGGTPIDDPGPAITLPAGFEVILALAIEPLDCTAPAPPEPTPLVIEPTFTG